MPSNYSKHRVMNSRHTITITQLTDLKTSLTCRSFRETDRNPTTTQNCRCTHSFSDTNSAQISLELPSSHRDELTITEHKHGVFFGPRKNVEVRPAREYKRLSDPIVCIKCFPACRGKTTEHITLDRFDDQDCRRDLCNACK